MGMYTEIYVNVDLKEDTPKSVIKILESICDGVGIDSKYPERWYCLFFNVSYYTPHTSVSKLTFNMTSNRYSLLGKGNINNYAGEIEAFFEFLIPWVDGKSGDFIGYSRYESEKLPTLVLLP